MAETIQNKEVPAEVKRGRPLLLGLLCISSFVLFGFISILFLLSVFYSGWIRDVINQYTTHEGYTKLQILFITMSGFILHGSAFAGVIQMWRLKRSGYYIFSIASLIISLYDLFQHTIPFSYTAIYIALVILFGIFYRKMK